MSYFGIPIRNGLPIGLGSVAPLASGGGSPFSPLSLFSGGTPGAWYDPSDLTTLFQDSAGTTPVTAVEQPVGLMLDKSQGLVLGNEILTNGTFESSIAGWTAGAGSAAWVAGTAQITGSAGVIARLYQGMTLTAGKWYLMTATCVSTTDASATLEFLGGSVSTTFTSGQTKNLYFTPASTGTFYAQVRNTNAGAVVSAFDNISVRELAGNHAFQATSASRPVLSARVNKLLATATLATQSVTTRATAHTLRFEGAGSVTLTGTAIGVYTAGTHSITTTAGTLTLTVLGSVTSADLRETNDGVGVPVYQAVVTSTNYNTTGFLPYLRFDGVDDSLSTNSISFTSTDKMSVFAGVRKLSDAAFGALVELSNNADTSNGTFVVWSPITDKYRWQSKGTNNSSAGTTSTAYNAPVTNTITGLGDISGDLATLRINAAQIVQSTTDQGTGSYGNWPLYIGRRNNASLPFNGQMYSMIIVGKAVTAGELSSTETYVNQKTGAY